MLMPDRVLFIDGEAIIIDKPRGLPVDPPRDGALCLENHLDSLKFGFKRWPTAVHRLDRDTSGCLLLARNPKAHARFSDAFAERRVAKEYLAVVEGVPDGEEGTIDLALSKHSSAKGGWRMIVDRSAGKAAVTKWAVVESKGGRTLVWFRPETGRTHQIRAHAAYGLGAAIVGDPIYGTASNAMLLHAAFLSVPRIGKPPVEARAALPDEFAKAGFSDG
jgi:tRNA pseudouridine32 synthase / 23S rRNA pseudouridine746 synthase